MGIKFNCPNGHKLNVKSFLAGRRGICPECDARFRIPLESGGVAEPVHKGDRAGDAEATQLTGAMQDDAHAGDAAGGYPGAMSFEPNFGSPLGSVVNSSPWGASPVAAVSPAASPIAGTAASANPASAKPLGSYPVVAADPLAEDPQAVWYVRPRSGGQYGPAVADILRDWIREGRVAGDSYVWREGWTDWRPASSVFPQLAGMLSAGAPAAMAAPVGVGLPVAGALPMGGGMPVGNIAAVGGAFPIAGNIASAAGVAVLGALPTTGMAGLESTAGAPKTVPLNKRVEARRKSGNFTALIVVMLVLVAIVLVGVFVWILFGKQTPAAAPDSAAFSSPVHSPASTI